MISVTLMNVLATVALSPALVSFPAAEPTCLRKLASCLQRDEERTKYSYQTAVGVCHRC